MAANSSPGTGRKDALTGILQSSLSPKYLHTNSTSHTWPFSAIAELIDNAYDPDVKASQLWIDKLQLGGKTCLTFTDNGNGMTTEKLHKMLSFGFCEKVPDGSHMPVGHYGNGFKSGSMRLGRDALVLTKQENSRSIGYLSQTYLEYIQAETVVVPIATWDKKDEKFVLRPDGSKALGDIVKYSLVHSDDELSEQFNLIPGAHGTRIVISNIRKTADNKPEFDFITDEYDIRIPDDANTEGGKYRQTKRQNHIPECDYSLKAYCAILYLKPKMQIILRGKKVKTLVVEKSLSKTEVDRYKPQGLLEPVKVVFGFNSRNKNHYGIMMYHRNRLIKPYERVGHQLKANNLGVGVVGVVQCDFLQPTHNKQDFDYTKSYRSCMNALGIKLNEYWNEKKGPARSTNNQLPIPEPQELQSLPDQTWVQCDKPSCLKWRKLPDGIDPDSLPDKWYCNMNPDPNYKSCDVPEEKDDDINLIQPYAKVQKKRLEKELQEKSRREKALKMAMLREQEEKKRELDEKERSLKQKEEELKRQYAALEDSKPKIKIEGQSKLPTAQVPPRPTTTKPYSAVTPTANQSTNHVTRSNQSTGSPVRPAQSAPFQVKIRPPSASHATNQLHPRAAPTNQSAPRALVSSQSASSNTPTNQSLRQALSNRLAQRTSSSGTQYTTLRPKPVESNSSSIKLVAKTTPGQLASRLTFKVMKSADGNTFLVQEKSGRTANAPNASPTLAKPGGNATPTPQKLVPVGMTPPSRDSTNATTNATVDIKPKLPIVLPKSQSSVTSSGVGRPGNDRVCYISPTTQSRGVEITNKTVTGSSLRDALTKANPAATVPASSFPRIVDAVSAAVTPPEDKKPVQIGVKRERGDDVMISPTPKKKVDAVIVIDPLPSETSQTNGKTKSVPESRLRELEVEWKEQMEKLQKQLKENSAQLAVKTAQLNQKTVKLNETSSILNERIIELKTMKSDVDQLTKDVEVKTTKLNDKTKQLKSLRTNVCKLLQVLVPEIDVESEEGSGEGETVDELLRQVLEANQ